MIPREIGVTTMLPKLAIALLCALVGAFASTAARSQTPPSPAAQSIQLSDYVALCVAVWNDEPDVAAKASALGLKDAVGASVTIGKMTIRPLTSDKPGHVVLVTSTPFSDGKDASCDINLPFAFERADLETMGRVLDLDGQIVTFGPTIMGRWKIRSKQPTTLIKATVLKSLATLNVQRLELAPGAGAK